MGGSFQELRIAEELFDVTLACEDETMEAHKVVLSACSPFFRSVFKKMKEKQPFIYLKGVMHKDLVALLDYIYTGETQVRAEDVDRFIEVGREMKVKGLTEDEVGGTNESRIASDSVSSGEDHLASTEDESSLADLSSESHDLFEFDLTIGSQNEIGHNASVSTFFHEDERKLIPVKEELLKYIESPEDREQSEKLIAEISNRTEKVVDDILGAMWNCTECGKMFKKKYKVDRHVETHLDGFLHKCKHCNKTCKTRGSLKTHISLSHRHVQ